MTLTIAAAAADSAFLSAPPMRPLPEPSARPLADGPAYFADSAKGDDAGSGSETAPWRSVNYALTRLQPGDTLYLRHGVYYENVQCTVKGEADNPITVRAYPGELVIVDAGYRQFLETPATAWEPYPAGASGEYRSTKAYPDLGQGSGRRGIQVVGNFGDSMIPLHGYNGWVSQQPKDDGENKEEEKREDGADGQNEVQAVSGTVSQSLDLRADPAIFEGIGGKEKQGIYCGPGVWLHPETMRVHVRLAHTQFPGLGERNYRGKTDPRRLPLAIGGRDSALLVKDSAHVRFQDLVFRGTRTATVRVQDSQELEFEGVHVYGGSPAFTADGVQGLKMLDSALRGVSAPWSNRSSQKYRGLSSYLFSAGRRNSRFVMAWSEFSDSHDGLIIGSIQDLHFHNNRVDNFNDDGLYLTTGYPPGRDLRIYQNYISRCLGAFSFSGGGKNQEQTIAYIHRNIIDQREPVNRSFRQAGSNGAQGRLLLEHGSPEYLPIFFYHNTVIMAEATWRGHYGGGLGQDGVGGVHRGAYRREIKNNIFFHVAGMPGLQFFYGSGEEWPERTRLEADGNLHWSFEKGPDFEGDFFAQGRRKQRFQPDWFKMSKQLYVPPAKTSVKPKPAAGTDVFAPPGDDELPPIELEEKIIPQKPGWTENDIFADPLFTAFTPDFRIADDFRLQENSAAVNAGLTIPEEWPDPLREKEAEKPDIGAMPLDIAPWRVGIRGRIPVFGPEGEGRYPDGSPQKPLHLLQPILKNEVK